MALDSARGRLLVARREDWMEVLGAAPAAPALAGYALECTDPAALAARLEALGCKPRDIAAGLFASVLPPALGSAWLFGTAEGLAGFAH